MLSLSADYDMLVQRKPMKEALEAFKAMFEPEMSRQAKEFESTCQAKRQAFELEQAALKARAFATSQQPTSATGPVAAKSNPITAEPLLATGSDATLSSNLTKTSTTQPVLTTGTQPPTATLSSQPPAVISSPGVMPMPPVSSTLVGSITSSSVPSEVAKPKRFKRPKPSFEWNPPLCEAVSTVLCRGADLPLIPGCSFTKFTAFTSR